MKKNIIFLLLFWVISPAFGQSTFIDSLEQLIPAATFSERIKLKYRTAPYLRSLVDIEEKLQQAQRYVEVATILNDSLLLDNAYWQLGSVYEIIGDTINSKKAFEQGKIIASQYGWSLGDSRRKEVPTVTFAGVFTTVYQDSSQQMRFDSIRKRGEIFELHNPNYPIDTNAVYWCKLKLRGHPEKTKEYVFQISSDSYGRRSWNNINAYLVHEDGSVEKQRSGFALRPEEKAVPYPPNLLRYRIAKNEKAVLYFRLEGLEAKRKPSSIAALLVDDGYYLDTEGGYEFKGQFNNDYGNAFVSNLIFHHEIVEDSTGTMQHEAVYTNWQSLNRKDWMHLKPTADKVYWLKSKFIGSPIFNGEQVIHVAGWAGDDRFNFDYVDGYIPDGKGGFHHQRTGNQVPLRKRPYDFWATFLKIDVPLNDTLEVLIRLEGADPNFLPNQIVLAHIDESSIWPSQINKGLLSGIILGILGVQALYFLLLFFMERERSHLYLSCFVLGFLLLFYFNSNNYYQFVALPIWKRMLPLLNWLSLFFAFFGLIKFTQHYFTYPKSTLLSKWIIPTYLSLLAIVVFLLSIEKQTGYFSFLGAYVNVFVGLGVVIVFLLVFTSKQQPHVSKSLFLLAFLPFFAAILFSIMLNIVSQTLDANSTLFNFLNVNQNEIADFFTDFLPFSIVFCLVMLALSAGKRTNGLKVEKEKALQKNLDAQKQRLAEQQRVNQAISRFVPNEFLHALDKSDITQITLGDTVEKEVTVFFSDIRDYTAIAEDLSPEENFQFVNAYNGRMGPIIQKNQGFVNQYLGDGIMAIFPQSPTDALRAAIQMQRVLQNYNQQRITEGRKAIKVGMGFHTGSLIMGITGDENRMDATTISDSVNSAARIESLSKYYGTSILLSEVSLKKVANPDEFHFRYLGEVQVKGKQKPLKIHECFDGEPSEVFDLKLVTIDTFNAGIEQYFKQSFSQAILHFEEVMHQNPVDKTAQLFLLKARQLEKMGVAENWTGVELMVQK